MVKTRFFLVFGCFMVAISSAQFCGISFGSYESGTYGGSLPKSIHANVYEYFYMHSESIKDPELLRQFEAKFDEFIKETMVNRAVSLAEYLQFVVEKNDEKINWVHTQFSKEVAKGNHTQPLSILIFHNQKSEAPVELHSMSCDLKGPKVFEFFSFVRKHGINFKSEVPDEFLRTHYSRFLNF